MTSKNSSLLKTHKIKKGEQVPLHVTNKQVRAISTAPKSPTEEAYERLSLDDKVKAKKGKLTKPKRVV